jgi:hypothetical protein
MVNNIVFVPNIIRDGIAMSVRVALTMELIPHIGVHQGVPIRVNSPATEKF